MAHGGGHGGGGFHGGGGGFHGGGGGFGQQSHWGGSYMPQSHQSGWSQQGQHPGYTSQAAGYGHAQAGTVHANATTNVTHPTANSIGSLQHASTATNFQRPQANVVNNSVHPNVAGSQLRPNSIASHPQPSAVHQSLANSITKAAGNKVPANNQLAARLKPGVNTQNSLAGGTHMHNVFKPKSGGAASNQSLAAGMKGKNQAFAKLNQIPHNTNGKLSGAPTKASNGPALAPAGTGGTTGSNPSSGGASGANSKGANSKGGGNGTGGGGSNSNNKATKTVVNPIVKLFGPLFGGDGGGGAGDVGGDESMPIVMAGGDAEPVIVADSGDSVVASTGEPMPADPAPVSDATQEVGLVLLNAKDSPGTVNYTLDTAAYAVDAGGSQGYTGSGPWLIEFDRGMGGVQARYSLTEGTYTFAMTDQGWDLFYFNATNASQGAVTSGSADATATDVQKSESSQRIVLQNPKATSGPVSFTIDGTPYTLAVGSTQELSANAPCLIEFDRGTGGATGRYTLASGYYTFSVSDSGWELTTTTYDVTLDNSGNGSEFYYLRDGRQESVPAGETRKLSDQFPITVRFDRGNGGEPVQRSLDQNGATYRIALHNASDGLDLISTSAR